MPTIIRNAPIQWVNTAIVGGNLSGNTRGANALDVQTKRDVATQVASGNYSSAIGQKNTASGNYDTAIGRNNTASANYSTAIGYKANARIQNTTNICGPQINRKDNAESAATAFESFFGVEVVLMSKEVDLKVAADNTITLPANCKFWLNEVGLIATV